jgi:uncharacterized protein YcbX
MGPHSPGTSTDPTLQALSFAFVGGLRCILTAKLNVNKIKHTDRKKKKTTQTKKEKGDRQTDNMTIRQVVDNRQETYIRHGKHTS